MRWDFVDVGWTTSTQTLSTHPTPSFLFHFFISSPYDITPTCPDCTCRPWQLLLALVFPLTLPLPLPCLSSLAAPPLPSISASFLLSLPFPVAALDPSVLLPPIPSMTPPNTSPNSLCLTAGTLSAWAKQWLIFQAWWERSF